MEELRTLLHAAKTCLRCSVTENYKGSPDFLHQMGCLFFFSEATHFCFCNATCDFEKDSRRVNSHRHKSGPYRPIWVALCTLCHTILVSSADQRLRNITENFDYPLSC